MTEQNGQEKQTNKNPESRLRRFYIIPVVITVVTAIAFVFLYMATVRRVQYIYTNQTYQNMASLKKIVVSQTVRELVTEIRQMHALRMRDAEGMVHGLKPAVREELRLVAGMEHMVTDTERMKRMRNYFADNEGLSRITCLVYNTRSGEILLDDKGLAVEAAVWSADITDAFAVSETVTAGGLTIVYGVTETAFDQEMLTIFSERLDDDPGESGTKFWIDKIAVLDNGKTSAVRVLDPQNPGKTGMDLNGGGTGKGPDRFATDGLLEIADGEQLFKTDNAEWQDDDGHTVSAQTMTCAQFYAPYQWAVCGAFRLDEIGLTASRTQEEARQRTIRLGAEMAIGFAVIVALAVLLIIRNNTNYFHIRQKKLKDQVERDALTGANTRGYGTQILEADFKRFRDRGAASPAIMVLDVDKFKSINDTYGHDSGDEALKRVVRAAQKVGRGRDHVIRWGGDEFIAVFYKLEHARCEAMANKLRRAVGDTQIEFGGKRFQVTISVGVTWFKFGDESFADALKRADEALYESKEQGRNRVCIAEI
ncbi:MAG: GGDEF domain-containing protein [Lachnospiraceae bacterium]|nr:GGDEF domain-containing protein [Lachnospiraceae bacterium]